MPEELKPCPFCGTAPRADMPTNTYCEYAECAICDLEMERGEWNHRASQWISVERKVPDVGQVVLVYRPEADKSHDNFVRMAKYTGVDNYSPQNVKHQFDCWCHPTHWMAIPKLEVDV
ncbi:DUF551 domain-containing protein [Sansalvadorimonas verongulae]|uniref:DUF551 domain-containing protein n=1 Tax=Sansalvadorimonas verongulae TaxID=2172824 RepID=UPI0012BB63B2|nr:DUF551 domain-containing protein [Sansalvadorimonas verongulae]MTI12142.1 DUF551 domain-containing protein [Sansalvadorimonas verongulae]